jgi:hypothetical protein
VDELGAGGPVIMGWEVVSGVRTNFVIFPREVRFSVVGRIVFGQLSQAQWQNGRADCWQNLAELAHQSLHFEPYSYL